jgi:hypothetical protein
MWCNQSLGANMVQQETIDSKHGFDWLQLNANMVQLVKIESKYGAIGHD